MRRNTFAYLLLPLLAMGLAFASCIRDEMEDCPPLEITLAVKDKNYFNADEVARQGLFSPLAEDLPFRDYVSSLYYVVHDAGGNVVAEQPNAPVTGDAGELTLQLPADLPYGKYRITVWGNMKSDKPLGGDATAAELEHADAAQNDVYLGEAEVDYRYGGERHRLELERAKGRLIIVAENLPDGIDLSEKTVNDVYSVVTSGFEYSSLVNLTSRTVWTAPNDIVTHTLTCPSEGIETSKLEVDFYATGTRGTRAAQVLSPDDIHITMGRNEITVVKYVYDESKGDFLIYMLVNDNWEQVHKMEID